MSYWITELSPTYYRIRLTQQVSLDNHNGWKSIFCGKTSIFIDQMINSLQSKSIAYRITPHSTTNATTQYKSILRNWCILLWMHIAHSQQYASNSEDIFVLCCGVSSTMWCNWVSNWLRLQRIDHLIYKQASFPPKYGFSPIVVVKWDLLC